MHVHVSLYVFIPKVNCVVCVCTCVCVCARVYVCVRVCVQSEWCSPPAVAAATHQLHQVYGAVHHGINRFLHKVETALQVRTCIYVHSSVHGRMSVSIVIGEILRGICISVASLTLSFVLVACLRDRRCFLPRINKIWSLLNLRYVESSLCNWWCT